MMDIEGLASRGALKTRVTVNGVGIILALLAYLSAPVIVSTSMRRRADIAALVIPFLVGACSCTANSAPAAQAHSSPLPGLTLTCTDRYQSSWSMGPIEDGQYVHYVCQNGKVTSWWVDDNRGTDDAPPG
jgi:hypothetical protein